ncbi:hypothetical protein HHK36_013757 [Tetracentron sinense]|uniref:Uncharacterized protein n=1 Tax=Tetracentron sinense TaxID=13715 RepID=A0A835DHN1_TETSI|nr:hypothetical protein HHK36_013757 [Tetracentron sinense]
MEDFEFLLEIVLMLPAATTHDKEVINFLIAPRFLLDFAADPNMAGLAASAVTIGRSLLAYVKHKCMEKMCCEVQKLREEGNLENGIIVESAPQRAQMMHTPRIKDKPSLHKVVEEVLDFLKESDIRRIGIWGLAGIGKTTIMQNLNNNDDITNFFDVVIWVTVSKERSMENIQHAVLERLKLNVEGIFSTDKVASRILEELESKRYLLLLDEVWDVIDLNALGLCVNEKNSKVVIASRLKHICCQMDSDILINVKRLSEADAWKLTFRKKDNIRLWRDGLRNLQNWPTISIQGLDEVLEILKFCYDELEGDDRKICFLYGALYPEDCDIYMDHLVECCGAEGFMNGTRKFGEVIDRGHTILHDLLDLSLLERSQRIKYVKMNKLLREMALKISSKKEDFRLLVKAREGLQDSPKEEEWKQAKRISLMDNELRSLPEMPDCPMLLTLFLQRNMELATIPESFFGSMCKLQVLDLHGTRIVSLPSSVSSLTCLRALYLNACIHLMELPSEIVQLQHLQVLDMRNTSINNLTSEIGSLVSLRCLRVSFNNVGSINHSRREMIHDRVISSLSKLEELSIDVNSSNQFWDEIADAVTEEVATLTQLTALRFYFPRVDCIYHAISEVLTEADAFELIGHKDVQRLSDFGTGSMDRMRGCLIEGCKEIETIIRGDQVTDSATLRQLEKLYMINLPKLRSIWEGPSQSGSFAHLTHLTMDQCQSLKKIFSKGMIQQLSELQYLSVEDCSEIEEIIIDAEDDILESDALPKLKTLILLNLPILESICKDEWLDWPSLETIKTSRCELLKTLPFSMDNAAKLRVIEGQEEWWTALDWKDMAVEQRLKSLCLFF